MNRTAIPAEPIRTSPFSAPTKTFPHPYSWQQRLRSAYHRLWYRLSERLQWSRGIYREPAAGKLSGLAREQATRIAQLASQYGLCFEGRYAQNTAIKNYAYLDLLDQAWNAQGNRVPRPTGGVMHDVGSANFWYAAALHTFFEPARLVGIEVEGHRLYPNGHSRWDAALGYISQLARTQFVAADYADFHESADVITSWFPFVTPTPLLAWRLPLSLFAPERLFTRVAQNLTPSGLFIMVNHSEAEAAIAAGFCRAAGLTNLWQWTQPHHLRKRSHPPVMSCWTVTHS
jgi:hypothetical protein